MIIPMKKLSLLLYHREKEMFLTKLHKLGVVHIETDDTLRSDNLDVTSNKLVVAQNAIMTLKKIKVDLKTECLAQKDGVAEDVIADLEAKQLVLENIDSESAQLKKDISFLEPWGSFNPEILKRLLDANIFIHFHELLDKKFDQLDKKDIVYSIISHSLGVVRFIVISREETSVIAADKITLPNINLDTAIKKLALLKDEYAEVKKEEIKILAYTDILDKHYTSLLLNDSFEKARINMSAVANGTVLQMTGWIPTKTEKKVAVFLDNFSAWFEITEPYEEDSIPIKMLNGPFSKLFEPVMKIFALPDYFELDPTPFFAPFFAFFFGLCLGDVGYGLLLIVISFIIRAKMANMKGIATLIAILGGTTILTGLLLNTFFGHAIFALEGVNGYFTQGKALAVLNPIETENGTVFPAMAFATYLGIIQILLGMFLKGVNRVRAYRALYFLHPLGEICMVIGATIMLARINFIDLGTFAFGIAQIGPVIAAVPQSIAVGIVGLGALLVILFNNPAKGILPYFGGSGLWALYGFVTGIMGDTLSYLRLFALGLAGGLLGAAFNDIAFMFVMQKDGSIAYNNPLFIVTIIVLVLGHTINFGLAALGSFVHPLRLTFVEFYKNLNFKGGGKAYAPFTKNAEV